MKKIIFCVCLLTFSLFQFSWATSVLHYQLKNGLNIYVKIDKRAPVVECQVWYKVGSSYEPNGLTGISHALEHMMFEGTTNYPDDTFSNRIAANGGDENAITDYDYTYYFDTLASNKLNIAFQLEADRMQNLTLNEASYKKQMNVVKEERRMRTDSNPQGLTVERFMDTAFLSSPYQHPVIGWINDLNHMTVNNLRNWYQQWYAPNNAIVVVVGDVNPKDVYQLAKKYFGAIPAHQLPSITPYTEVTQSSERTVIVNAPAKLPWLIMGYKVPSLKTAIVPWEPYALELAADILDSGNSSRFPAELIRGSEVASAANTDYDPFTRLSTLFILVGTPSVNHTVPQLQQALLSQIKMLQTTPVTAAELDRVKIQLLAQETYAKDSIDYQAQLIGNLEAVGLNWQIGENYVDEVNKITPAQIQAVAKKYFIDSGLTIAYLKPMPMTSTTDVNSNSNLEGDSHVH